MKQKISLNLALLFGLTAVTTFNSYAALPATDAGLDLSKKLSISKFSKPTDPSTSNVSAIVDDGTPLEMSPKTDVDGPPLAGASDPEIIESSPVSHDEYLEDMPSPEKRKASENDDTRLQELSQERQMVQKQKLAKPVQEEQLAAITASSSQVAPSAVAKAPESASKVDRIPTKHVSEVLERIRLTYSIAKKFQVAVDYRSYTKQQLEKYSEKLEKHFSDKTAKARKIEQTRMEPQEELNAEI